jgi:hypothetical protein
MKRLLLPCLAFLLAVIPFASTAEEISGVEIADFKAGLMRMEGDWRIVYKETTTIPLVVGSKFGVSFHYDNTTGEEVEERTDWYLPGAPKTSISRYEESSFENDNTHFTGYFSIPTDGGGSHNDWVEFTEGDPLGTYRLEIRIGGKLFKTVQFTVVEP